MTLEVSGKVPDGARKARSPFAEITKDVVRGIIRDIGRGYGVAEAVAQADIDPELFNRWLLTPPGLAVVPLIRKAFAQADARAIDGLESSTEAFSWQATKARIELRHMRERERQVGRLNHIFTEGAFG